MVGFPLTDQQRRVVEHRQGALLVSAAAGSGKTRVLVERLLDRVTREERDLDEFLVITYTKAAAAELRARIAQELSQRLGEQPGNRHLRRQSTLVYKAKISTVHAFCAQVLRESGHLIALPADFRLCDEGEAVVLMQQVLGDVMDRRYEQLQEGDGFSQLVDTLSAGRDDTRLEQIVLDVLGRMQSHADPEGWLKAQVLQWQVPQGQDMAQTPWGALLLEDARRQGEYCLARMARALELAGRDPALAANYAPSISETMGGLERLVAACARGWDQVAACFPIPFPTAGRKKGTQDEGAAALVKAIRARCKKQMEGLAGDFGEPSAPLGEDLRQTFPVVQALALLVQDVSRAYGEEKRRRGVLDFSDLEHLALKLLTGEEGGHSPLALLWSSRFAEVMVDEYQDTNQVQDAIFTAVSHNGRKLFMVGDVKQSIYRFRLADPTIFLEKYHRFLAGGEEEGRALVLSQNFRSRPQVLEGCNDLFRALMSREFGEVDYTDDQALVPGAVFPPAQGTETELLLLDLSYQKELEGDERQSKDLLEARHCARRVKELLERPMMVAGEDGLRPLEPGDVLILLRSPGTVLPHYLRAFGEAGIPVASEGGGDLFEATETNVALALLRLADNPRQDVSLVAALRSPVFGFTEDDLARLRAARPQGDLYAAVEGAAEEADAQCSTFLEVLAALRFDACDMTVRELVWHIYEKTNLLGIFGAMEGGEVRRENLLALYHLAAQLEEGGCRSLFQFLLRLDRIRDTGKRFPAANPRRQVGGVSIMSIHRSKGLERPVVLVCGLSRRLNRDDLMRPVLFHPKLGFGPKGLDQRRMVEYPTLARRAVARQLEKEMYAEELRLLYVAMTRAKEKLILSVALTEGGKTLERMGEDLGAPPSPMALEQQSSVGQWVLLHALTRPEAEGLRTLFGLPQVVAEGLGPRWDIRLLQGAPLPLAEERELAQQAAQEGRGYDLEALTARLAWVYPYAGATETPSKITVTQLKGREVDREAAEEAQPAQPPRWEAAPLYRPDFIAEQRGLTPAQRGTALHLAMQYLPLGGDHSTEGVVAELERLVAGGFLTPLQAQAAHPRHLSAFLTSPLGRAMANAKVCRREFKFSLLVPAVDYLPQAQAGEELLLQGVIDCWFEEEDGITILDFKSDRVTAEEMAARAEEYRVQLEGYANALEEILSRPVRRKIVWFFSCNGGVELT